MQNTSSEYQQSPEQTQPQPVSEAPAQRLWSIVDVILIVVAVIAIIFLGTLGIRSLLGQTARSSPMVLNIAVAALEFVAIVLSIYLIAMRRKHLTLGAIGYRPLSNYWFWTSIGMSISAIVISRLILVLAIWLFKLPTTNTQLPFIVPQGLTWVGIITMVFLVGIAIPFAKSCSSAVLSSASCVSV